MPIPTSELKRDFIVVDERATVRQVRDQVADARNQWTYIIVGLDDGRYAVLRLNELIQVLQGQSDALTQEMLDAPVASVSDLLAPRAGDAVEGSSMGIGRARQLLNKMPGKRLVVLAEGEVIGLLAAESRSAQKDVDLDWLEQSVSFAVPRPEPAAPKGAEGVLGVEDEETMEEAAPPIELVPEKRYVNAEIENHDPHDPLQMGEVYALAFDVDIEVRDNSLGGAELGWEADQRLVGEVTVQLASDDFEIYSGPQRLLVPPTGRSKNKARFDIEPKHEGQGVINAVFLKDGNFIQLITLKLQVGGSSRPGVLKAETQGRPLDAAFAVQPRDVSLTIFEDGNEFQLIMSSGAVWAQAKLPITLPQLDQIIAQARQELQSIVHLEVDSQKVYQAGIDISPQVNQMALGRLAKTGFRLYQRIFFGPDAEPHIKLIGSRLREMARRDTLKIQIFSKRFVLPWGILYMADKYDPDQVDPELFLGLKHIIEHIPLQQDMQVISGTLDSQPKLTVSLNVNTDIDKQMGVPLIAGQRKHWDEIAQSSGIQLLVRETKDDVTQALADAATPDHILYFYCHAVSKSLAEGGGPDASTLVLSNKGKLTLGDLYIYAPTDVALPGAPLVFINACESAELSPLFYDGFAPYFMAKGARGVIGTECETPALFAAEWARRFFDHFLTGKSLGQAFLDLRREFYFDHNNLMGLLYALYCDGDTQVVPGLQI
jgi:hypothetical protein